MSIETERAIDETEDQYIAGLKRERAGYEARDLDERVKEVDKELGRARRELAKRTAAPETADEPGAVETADEPKAPRGRGSRS